MSEFLQEAITWLGTPFKHQHKTKGVGCDCFGFVRGVTEEVTGELTEVPILYSPNWMDVGTEDYLRNYMRRNYNQTEGLEPGNIMLFKLMGVNKHLGIVVDHNSFIHAIFGKGVSYAPLNQKWLNRVTEVYHGC